MNLHDLLCLLYIWVQTDLYKVNHTHTLCSQKFSFLYFDNYLPHHRMVQINITEHMGYLFYIVFSSLCDEIILENCWNLVFMSGPKFSQEHLMWTPIPVSLKYNHHFQRCNLRTVNWWTWCPMYLYFRQLIQKTHRKGQKVVYDMLTAFCNRVHM